MPIQRLDETGKFFRTASIIEIGDRRDDAVNALVKPLAGPTFKSVTFVALRSQLTGRRSRPVRL